MATDLDLIRSYYASFDEWGRLDAAEGALEFQRACALLRRHLPSGSRVLDLGGGPGRYAAALAAEGHRVVLADLSPELLETARKKLGELGVLDRIESIDAVNATDLDRYDEGQFDAVVAFGPFYHLLEPAERSRAAAEIRRVLRDGGLVFAAFISRASGVMGLLDRAADRPEQAGPATLREAATTGRFRNESTSGFQEGYYPLPDEVAAEFRMQCFVPVETVSLRALAHGRARQIEELSPELRSEVHRLLDAWAADPHVVATCGHAVFVGRKAGFGSGSSRSFPSRPAVEDRALYELTWNGRALPVVALACELGLLDHLAKEPLTIRQVGDWLAVQARAAEAMVAVLAAAGFLARDGHGRFAPTALTRVYLLESSPLRHPYLIAGPHEVLDRLRESFSRGGAPVESTMVDMPEQSVDEARPFIDDMHRITLAAATGLGELPVFGRIQRLLDVAGGSGSLCCGIAAHHPEIRCTLLDLPAVCAIAEENIARYGLDDRIRAVPGDMFRDPWPGGHDGVLFGNIFHDWDPERCRRLARTAFESLEPGGMVFLHEMLLDETKDGPLLVACFSINMLLYEHGKQYTLSELRAFLEEAGFEDVAAVPSFGYYSLVSARKPA